ncbi:hypothetical protein JCM19240_4205 [Vibrio maritimus]|uniref:DUF3626 domain-containing protein n=1 Tax=Vibrio maritimus TaxID=990268 RepID=A0A090T3W3_9VIBR|nr:hypothetical protein JCM19240_4205 [Vibrio maritimus]
MSRTPVETALTNIRQKSTGSRLQQPLSITINFHPDRLTTKGEPLLLAMAKSGSLKSQFETQTSNGGLTAFKGGERWHWEQRVFDGAYDDAPNKLRPKYGALNYREYPMGASPRFGSSYFKLKPHVFERSTFCYPDSYFNPKDFATSDALSDVVAMATETQADLLDDYIEAHIHGELSLSDDVESLVLDPVYRSTPIEQQALALGVAIKWHSGFKLTIEKMSQFPNYRGQEFVELGKRLAVGGIIDARALGSAVTEQGYDEQAVKKVWHYLARFGYRGKIHHTCT